MSGMSYHRPRSLDEVWRLREGDAGARLIAGGTDIQVGRWSWGGRPSALISLRAVPELDGIEIGDETRIGAATVVGELAEHAGLLARYPALVQAARRLGSPQIRNAATAGGNLCRAAPCADLAPPLIVYGARLRLRRPGGAREVPVEEFMRGPGVTALAADELVTDVLIPPPPDGARARFSKKGRVYMDLSLASVAVLVVLADGAWREVRVAAGSVGPIPMRLREVEERLAGQAVSPALVDEAGEIAARAVLPITDVRATAEYRRTIVGVYVKRALRELAEEGAA